MNNAYPKIYSLSTAGVRQHNNSDYLLHPIRTDFTGDNGLGKSIIADLMQLIFIPRRDMWRPGTEGVDRNERRVDGIPLNKDYVTHAYTFLNIERYQGRFIVMGVFIPKNSRNPVRPFIIQKSANFESGDLMSIEHPIKAADFIDKTGRVYDLKEIKEVLKEKYDVHFRDFFRADEINQYYELLYKNQILPIDLTKEANVRAYAKILQSFSRAKTLDINNSRSLQNFLFEDNHDIRALFDEQKDLLISYIRQYNTNRDIIKDLERKQNRLLSLKKLLDKSNEARIEYYKGDAVFAETRFKDAQRHSTENKMRLDGAMKNYQKSSADAKRLAQNILVNYYELRAICSLLKTKYEDQVPLYTDEKIEEKRAVANNLWGLVNELDKVAPVYKKYKNVKAIQKQLSEQAVIREQKKDLEKLLSIKSFDAFEESEWAKDYKKAYELYQNKLAELPQTIAQLKNLLELYESGKDDSLLHWAIAQKRALTVGEETVVMHLKDVMMKKPKQYEEGYRYTLSPDKLMKSFEPNGEGVWLTLGELKEWVPYVKKQKFDNAKTLKHNIENDRNEIKENLKAAQKELETIGKLNRELSEIGYNAELCAIFKDRERIQNFEVDDELNESVVPIIEANLEHLDKYDEIKGQYDEANEQATQFAKKQTELDIQLEEVNSDIINLNEKIEAFQKENKIVSGYDDMLVKKLGIEQLQDNRISISKENERLLAEKETAERSSISYEGVIASCREREKQIAADTEIYQKDFEEKKRTLEQETDLKFDELLQAGGYTERMIRRLELAFIDARRDYEEEFTRIAQSFDETRDHRNPEVENDKYNFFTLVKVLCGKLGLEGLGPELEKLNEELRKFGDLQMAILVNVFTQVEKQYNSLRRLITDLNFFFKENKISTGYHFRIDWIDRKDIEIAWIHKMREQAKVQRFGADLFTESEGLHHADNSPEKLIVSIAQTFSSLKDCELEDLLNPKFYFDLRVGLYDDYDNRYSGSGGQAYTALALLCIGRLSVIQRDKNRPGIRFIIIEELSNIDDTNFGLFPQIAEQFSYQLMTMTPKPFGSYSEENWFLHMLIRGKDKDINYHPMSFFKTRNSKRVLEDYFSAKN